MLTARARRAGFTLVELMAVMLLLGFVGAAILSVMMRQQRFYRAARDLIDTRQQIRQAVAMLPADLRGISSVGGDIYVMTDSSVEFRSTFGTATVCNPNITVSKAPGISVAPLTLAKGNVFTSWSQTPVAGDSMFVYDDGASSNTSSDDIWQRYQISNVLTQTDGTKSDGCLTTTGLVQAGDVSKTNPAYQLFTNGATPSKTIATGSAVRIFRRVHYSLYRSATDNKWYLGYYDCVTGRTPVCNAIQPIAGPFQAYANNSTSGLQFTYYDSTGAVTATKTNVARISVVARGQGTQLVTLSGAGTPATFADSLRVEVGLRNRK
jgi:prepilin-type N-terminal cleavage/methylation domain-containing protein